MRGWGGTSEKTNKQKTTVRGVFTQERGRGGGVYTARRSLRYICQVVVLINRDEDWGGRGAEVGKGRGVELSEMYASV